MRRILTLCTLLWAALWCPHAAAQPAEKYAYPVLDVEGLCSANFGEIRPGHFHAGIDIKTDGETGRPIVAMGDGHVSRVTVTPSGFGRALYLTLADGTTAVYGHLEAFRDDIERCVDEERHRRRTSSVDLRFGPERWPVRQGDRLGASGNSGSSLGPHLHIELREPATGRRLNLVRQGIIRPKDDLPPRIVRLHYIEVDTLGGIAVESAPESYAVLRTSAGRYRMARREPVPVGRRGYFVAEVTDRRNGVANTFGVWRVAASLDGERIFEYRMEGFTPDQSRACDVVAHYPLQLGNRNEAIRLARAEGAPGAFYRDVCERGLVRCPAGRRRTLRIEAEDDRGNRSTLTIEIEGRPEEFRARHDPAYTPLHPAAAHTLRCGEEFRATLPAGALFGPAFGRAERLDVPRPARGVVVLSPAYRIFDTPTPLRIPIGIALRSRVPTPLHLHATLARVTDRGELVHAGGRYSAGEVAAETRTAGAWCIVADTLRPTIRPLFDEGADLGDCEALCFRISDNFSGIVSCRMEIDGEWVPVERLPMQSLLYVPFRSPREGARHTVRLTVRDGAGNTARWEGRFRR